MSTPYDVLYSGLMSKIRDYEWLSLTWEEIKGLAHDYLRPAIARFQYCIHDLSDRDDLSGQFNFAMNDIEIQILVDLIAIEWLNGNFILTSNTLKQSMPSKDYQMWSPGNHLDKLEGLHKRLRREVDVLKSTYSKIKNKDKILGLVRGGNRRWLK